MHLRSIALRGFKSFPDRTRLDFSPGVSVVVGPNGSGKSNITDAVLWALGEQSPIAVRGQTMQDVIFAGGHGVASRDAAEVEVVIDNADGGLASDFTELSIVRRLERTGDGEYRMNGARCRLVDVQEALSDTGLGREMHSVVSQGRVDAIVASRPRERRLLIEEAAGLGKHRKRRRRAQLKLERTEQNLSRALDVEREARSRLRPLKRQAEAAELTRRLERQSLEARLQLISDRAHTALGARAGADEAATGARAAREEADGLLTAVAARREAAERDFAAHARSREALAEAAFGARSAQDAVTMRLERARDTAVAAADGSRRRADEHAALERERVGDEHDDGDPTSARVRALESELSVLEAQLSQRLGAELAELDERRAAAEREHSDRAAESVRRRSALSAAERLAEAARADRRDAERALEGARDRAARAGGELAAVNQFLRGAVSAPGAGRSLAELVRVDDGYELALAAALGSLMRAAVAGDVAHAEKLLDAAGAGGGSALLERPAASASRSESTGAQPVAAPGRGGTSPAPGARPLLEHVQPAPAVAALVERLLDNVWVVDSLAGVSRDGFSGLAVTRAGRLLVVASGEVRQAPRGGDDRLVAEAGRRDRLIEASEAAARAEAQTLAALEACGAAVEARDEERDRADASQRAELRELDDARERVGALERELDRRRSEPGQGVAEVRRAELAAELRAERRLAEQAGAERRRTDERLEALAKRIERDRALAGVAERCARALEAALAAVSAAREQLDRRLAAGEASADRLAAELRACAHQEAEVQRRLRVASDALTSAEVTAQRARDAAAEAGAELAQLAARLGVGGHPAAPVALEPDRRSELESRLELLERRREQLGPVNPLAGEEYEAAVAHVEELERQRADLESALGEVQRLIRDTDKLIRDSFEETFAATARNFEEVVGHLFPGGRGRLALVHLEGPRPVLGDGAPAAAEPALEAAAEAEEAPPDLEPGVEVEVTPAGKSTKRLSLLSGGEKSLVALAFLFAVFLARPCPFYILDEVEAALDDINIDRFLQLVRRSSDRAQFIIVTHQKRTMDAADVLYGVSMGGDGVSKVVSRRLTGPSGAGAAESTQADTHSRVVA